MDDNAGRTAGYDGAFGMGYLQWSSVHDVLRDFVGDRGRIDRVQSSFRAPSLKGAEVTAGGQVRGVSTVDGRLVVDVALSTRTGDGVELLPGTATVSFPVD